MHAYPTRASRLNSDIRLFDHNRYLMERESYLDRRPNYQKSSNIRAGGIEPYGSGISQVRQSRLKKSFSEKVYSLLREVKEMK